MQFSVVVPAYNATGTLCETLDGILAQTFDDWECIIVDDGSTDDTPLLAASYASADTRFRVLTQENRGTGGAYNAGVAIAQGQWITICSSDDVLLPRLLETMCDAMAIHPDVSILSCNGYYWTDDGSRTLVYSGGASTQERSWSLGDVLQRSFFSVGACYRRELFSELGGYSEAAFGEDYDFWLRALAHGAKHCYVPVPLALHRVSATQKSANLRRAYESDIAAISGLMESGQLDRHQMAAAESAIRRRRRLIREVEHPHDLRSILRRQLRRLRSAGR